MRVMPDSKAMRVRKVYFVPDPYEPDERVCIGAVTSEGFVERPGMLAPSSSPSQAIIRMAIEVLRGWRDTSRLPDACSAHIQLGEP